MSLNIQKKKNTTYVFRKNVHYVISGYVEQITRRDSEPPPAADIRGWRRASQHSFVIFIVKLRLTAIGY